MPVMEIVVLPFKVDEPQACFIYFKQYVKVLKNGMDMKDV